MRATYEVAPDGERWIVRLEGHYTPLAVFDHRNEAVKDARHRAERDLPSRLLLRDRHGHVQSDRLFGRDQLEEDIAGMRALEPDRGALSPMPEMEDEEA